jgi:Flp pilus assembly protein TadG
MKRRFWNAEGGALVEIALASPLMLLMMLGAFELGRVAHHAIEVENAARAGASYGSNNPGSSTDTPTITQAAKNDAPDLANLSATPGSACVCETLTIASGSATFNPSSGTLPCTNAVITTCNAVSPTTAQFAIRYVSVSSQSTVTAVFHVGAAGSLPSSYNTNGYSFMRVLPN